MAPNSAPKHRDEGSGYDIPPECKLIGMKTIMGMTEFTHAFFYKKIAEKKFPEPIKFGRKSRWILSDVLKWIEEHKNK
ncbi:helix-turn-helix transcriptional regulator [Buttiauxella sp. S19-1]|uniref:helix-turn-helix transcriptional regulator n=1 Tax=Buttiauxella sp. S19-1 TaxID=941430 RepID=UPI001EDAB6EF|nr:AlpA family phage regulatory protein [Buttiauxella sp. S19-1]